MLLVFVFGSLFSLRPEWKTIVGISVASFVAVVAYFSTTMVTTRNGLIPKRVLNTATRSAQSEVERVRTDLDLVEKGRAQITGQAARRVDRALMENNRYLLLAQWPVGSDPFGSGWRYDSSSQTARLDHETTSDWSLAVHNWAKRGQASASSLREEEAGLSAELSHLEDVKDGHDPGLLELAWSTAAFGVGSLGAGGLAANILLVLIGRKVTYLLRFRRRVLA